MPVPLSADAQAFRSSFVLRDSFVIRISSFAIARLRSQNLDRVIRNLAALMVGLLLASIGWSAEPAAAPLGSPDYRPTPEHPFGWRGDGSGQFPGATPLTEWSEKKNVRWSVVVGLSYSSPILTDSAVIVTAEPNVVACVARADGKLRWKTTIRPADLADATSRAAAAKYKPPEAGAGLAAATPLTDGTSIYVLFANGILAALDMEGKPKWASYIDARRAPGYGRSASPILYAGKLLVHMTNLYAFDPATGKQLWMNDDAKSNYGTPLGMKIGDVDLIVTAGGDVVGAADGKTLDTTIGLSFHASPIVRGDVVYFGEGSVAAVRLAVKGGKYKDKELWDQMVPGDVFGSPLLHDGLLFLATGRGELFAFDASDKGLPDPVIPGRPLFGDPGPAGPPGGSEASGPGGATPVTYSSLTLAGKYMILNTNQVHTVVLAADHDAKPIAKNHLPDGSGASPIFSGGDMYLRDGNKLMCIGR